MPDSNVTLPRPARDFLERVAAAPGGLGIGFLWQDGRGGWTGSDAEAFRACSRAGLTVERTDRFLLTQAGVDLLGLTGYTAHDPSTWAEDQAERYFLKGHCHAIAVALHRHRGYGLVALCHGNLPLHVFAEDPDGTPHDFDGPTTRERMLADCGVRRATFVPLPDEASLDRFCGRGNDSLAELHETDIAMALRYVEGRPDKFTAPASPTP